MTVVRGERPEGRTVRLGRVVLSALALLAAVPAPADTARPDDVQSLIALQQLDEHVADVGWRILSSGLEFCPDNRPSLGISLHTASQYASRYRAAAVAAFGFDEVHPSVLAVASGSPAQVAGILPNDVLLSVGGHPTTFSAAAEPATGSYADADKAMDLLDELPRGSPVQVIVARHGHQMTITVPPQEACPSRVELAPGNSLNSSANGKVANINGAMAVWVRSDDELALVIGHEVAHNILGHPARIEREHLDSALSLPFGSGGRKLRDMEREADSLGTWLAARAGYNYRIAPEFWARVSKAAGGFGAFWATTHPAPRNRAENVAATVREIDAKMAR